MEGADPGGEAGVNWGDWAVPAYEEGDSPPPRPMAIATMVHCRGTYPGKDLFQTISCIRKADPGDKPDPAPPSSGPPEDAKPPPGKEIPGRPQHGMTTSNAFATPLAQQAPDDII